MKFLTSILLLIAFFSDLSFAGDSYVDNGDSTITDKNTGLMWVKTETSPLDWAAALNYCESLTLAGKSDWRLPNSNELQSLVDYSKTTAPTINTTYFPSTSTGNSYWSSTTCAQPFVQSARLRYFGSGSSYCHLKYYGGNYVRCVR